jgi:hypothetical protein
MRYSMSYADPGHKMREHLYICRRPRKHFLTPHHWNPFIAGLLWHIRWPMTHANDDWDKCDICHKCDIHDLCHTVTQYDTIKHKKIKKAKIDQICNLRNEIDDTHCDTMWHFDMFVILTIFKLIGPSNDGRRHGRGTYLFTSELDPGPGKGL